MSKTFQRPVSLRTSATAEQESSGAVIFTVVSDVPDNGTDEFLWMHQVQRAGVEIPGFKASYESTSGIITVEDAGAVSITSGDIVVVSGTFYR